MKNIFCFLLFVTIVSSNVFSQELNQKYHDPRLDKEVLIGYCDVDGLRWGEFRECMVKTYDKYDGDEKVMSMIKDNWQDVTITMILASWCHDCKEQVPVFLRLLQETGFDNSHLTIIAVNREKTAGEIDISELGIESVPTMIFYRDGEELGRIVESPEKSLEKDTYNIIE